MEKLADAAGSGSGLRPGLGATVSGRISLLAARMRAEGVRIGVSELLGAHRALAVVDASDRDDVRAALRAALCAGHDELAVFERSFVAVFGTPSGGTAVGEDPLEALGGVLGAALPRAALPGNPPALAEDAEPRERRPVPAAWSEIELLRDVDFAHYDDAMAAATRPWLESLARRGPARRSRRMRAKARRTGSAGDLDLRGTVRSSLRTGGMPLELRWRARTVTARRLVLVCDVSGSMAPYARMLLRYVHACVRAHRQVEAFAFGTRLTRITPVLSSQRDPDAALARAAAAVVDLSGGTRIGACLGELNRVHGRRIGRGAVVVLLSDGWDRGDPLALGAELSRLRRTAHRLIWLNPLAAHPEYEPITRGMRAAMPHTDTLLAGNSLAALERLAETLEET